MSNSRAWDQHNVPVSLVAGVRCLLKSRKYSDLTVKCGDSEWKVHKAIVCPQSDFFEKAADGGFMEAQQNVITLQEDDPEAAKAMLDYMYLGDYEDTNDIPVHTIADKYNISFLAALAARKLQDFLETNWMHDSFSSAIQEVYMEAPDREHALRDAVIAVSAQHARELFSNARHTRFQEVARTVPAFAPELAAELAAPSSCDLPRGATSMARKVYKALEECHRHEGLHVEQIAGRSGLCHEDVIRGAEDLMGFGLIYTTLDDYTWRLLEV